MIRYYCKIDDFKNIIDYGIGVIPMRDDGLTITKEEYELLRSGGNYKLDDKKHIIKDISREKEEKIMLLDTIINGLKEQGIIYQDKWFKCDDEAKSNLADTMLMLDMLLMQGPIKWYTRNGEEGYIEFSTKEEFMSFIAVLGARIADLKTKYYNIKTLIQDANTEEELNNIDIEGLLYD